MNSHLLNQFLSKNLLNVSMTGRHRGRKSKKISSVSNGERVTQIASADDQAENEEVEAEATSQAAVRKLVQPYIVRTLHNQV